MPVYDIINKDNNPNRKARLEKELQGYTDYLSALLERSNRVLTLLQQRRATFAKENATA